MPDKELSVLKSWVQLLKTLVKIVVTVFYSSSDYFITGITVCMPTPAACLKEVAKQISDRDNSVRNAALNCVVQAYNIVGEKVYKLVGNVIIIYFAFESIIHLSSYFRYLIKICHYLKSESKDQVEKLQF